MASRALLGQVLSHYRILELLGAGGMGVVYRARDMQLERDVAIKILPPESVADPTAKARLLREARTASQLNHQNICTIYEVGEAEGQAFIAMELVAGQPLSAKLRGGPLTTDLVVRYGLQLTEALAHAHQKNVIHRDLKSGNVMVTPEGLVKVLDFGLAKQLAQQDLEASTRSLSLTQEGAVVGTLGYMAPELLRGRAADARSDVWALGVVLHEMAAGKLPFRGQTGFELSSAVLNQPPAPLPSNVPVEVRAVVERCLEKEPARRYQSGGEVHVSLEGIQSGTVSVLAGVRYRLSRRRWLAGVAATLFVLALTAAFNFSRLRTRFAGAPQIESLAVLPLANLSGDPQQDYFVDGITDELITELARIGGVRVISRTSSMKYKQSKENLPLIARELGVDAVIEGAVAQAGQRVRVTVQLIRADSDQHLWANSYERDLTDILALQAEIASAVARELRVELALYVPPPAMRKPVKGEAYAEYLKGRYLWNLRREPALLEAIDHFEQAARMDSSLAVSYSGLADAYTTLGYLNSRSPAETFPQARIAAEKALELDSSLAEPHASLAYYYLYYERDWDAAEREFRKAIELNSNYALAHDWYGVYLTARGRWNEALKEIARARQLDPLSLPIATDEGFSLYYSGKYDQAIASLKTTLERDPGFPLAHLWLGRAYEEKGMYADAIAEFQQTQKALPGWPVAMAAMGWVYGVWGKPAEARKALAELQALSKRRYVTPYALGLIHASLGERDMAFRALQQGAQERTNWMVWTAIDPRWKPIRDDPRFTALLQQIRLQD